VTAIILDGHSLAATIQAEIAAEVGEFTHRSGVAPCLAAVLVGDNAASEVYVRNKRKACERAGIRSELARLSADATHGELLQLVQRLNGDENVHGILVQLPLPGQIDTPAILRAVSPNKDVDAFHPENVGLLVQGQPRFLPCTPQGVIEILKRHNIATAARHVVILGRSDIVGKPLANMLVQRGVDATVTVCHSRTPELPALARQADILVAAIGQPRFVTAGMVKPGAVVIDVGINRLADGSLVGDVDFDAVKEIASHITPVPRGVGPLTIAMLLRNTLTAARMVVGGQTDA
jgi:methylenetetrahydrofolate dehydrogenase (NADP+)/methenyltetrahydrofolate cyclohydrolase